MVHSALSEPSCTSAELLIGSAFFGGGFCSIKRLMLKGQPKRSQVCSACSGTFELFAHARILSLKATFGKKDVTVEIHSQSCALFFYCVIA